MHETEHLSVSEIARRIGWDRKTVRRALKADRVPARQAGAPRISKLDAYKDQIALRLKEFPPLAGSLLFEETQRLG